MDRITRVVGLVALGAATLGAAACHRKQERGAAADGPVLLGHVTSLTGDQATFGESTDNGFKLAIAEANAKGGVRGRRLALKTYDDQGKAEEAAVAATRLITTDKVVALLGEVASSRTLAVVPIAESYQVPLLTSASTNPKVTRDGDRTRPYVFGVCFIDPFQGTVMARFITPYRSVLSRALPSHSLPGPTLQRGTSPPVCLLLVHPDSMVERSPFVERLFWGPLIAKPPVSWSGAMMTRVFFFRSRSAETHSKTALTASSKARISGTW